MKTLKPEDVKKILNVTWQAVDESRFGPLYIFPDPHDLSKKQVNQLGFAIIVPVVSALIRATFGGNDGA